MCCKTNRVSNFQLLLGWSILLSWWKSPRSSLAQTQWNSPFYQSQNIEKILRIKVLNDEIEDVRMDNRVLPLNHCSEQLILLMQFLASSLRAHFQLEMLRAQFCRAWRRGPPEEDKQWFPTPKSAALISWQKAQLPPALGISWSCCNMKS